MQAELIDEARRQIEICNACRYCEGFCSVFPSIHADRAFSDGDITHLANLCHNCRGCYYACQYTAPHQFDLNLPAALAEVRQKSWSDYAWPQPFARLFERNGVVVATCLALATALLFWIAQALRPVSGEGFYAYLSHGVMVSIFAPAFLFPLIAMGVSIRRYWADTVGRPVTFAALKQATKDIAAMKNLSGGHGEGCNFEDEDGYSHARRFAHQLTLWGFLLCFASTSSGTVLHYGFGLEAPYAFFSLPKLLGVPGGLMLCAGTAWLARLKLQADPELGAKAAWGGEMAFVALLFAVSATGLLLYSATGSALVSWLLPLHLGTVLALFLLIPYSKMAHGFYRTAALIGDSVRRC
ncbi:MAG: tricarballylate utilization 4Fe-4S protein TcuB [Pseudomonadota bacterium]